MGIIIALTIILVWSAHLYYSLVLITIDFSNPLIYLHILLQGYLYTGLFITGHDAMHKTVSKNRTVNNMIGGLSTILFAGLSYKRLIKNHMKHHKSPATEDDPDYFVKSQNFFLWYGTFMLRYATITQLVYMAVLYNILKIWINEVNIILFWVTPAFLGSLQLFYFGTYLPHRKPHTEKMEPHKARTQTKNHLWAMFSCYFFGYHFEHHDSPHTSWWKLYQTKQNIIQ